jgi:hypothetical protein
VNCLDPETLAAWMDGGLSGAALEDVRSHVADCVRCQALVGAMGRTRVAVPPTQPERARRWWLAWAVPLSAAATAAAIWVAVPRHPDLSVAPSPTQSLQKQEASPQGAAAASATPPKGAQPAAEPVVPKAAPQPQARARARAAETPAPARREAANEVAQQKADALSETVSTPSAAPAAPPAAAGRSAGVGAQIQARTMAAATANSFCGGSWPAPPADVGREITTGSAPSADVCWMAGRNGIVLRSTDHQIWQRVTFPENVDLSTINATDARTATVVTVDGRTFSTSDGGVTWTQR